jgi:exonuclease III
MILISWNCRGLENPKAVRDLCLIVKEKQPNFLFLIETKSSKNKMDRLRSILGFHGVFVVDTVGRSGGLALLWKEDSGLSISNFSKRHINATIPPLRGDDRTKFGYSQENEPLGRIALRKYRDRTTENGVL